MTAPTEDIHSCSMYCTRPACVLAQRDEMRAEIARLREQDPVDMSMILGAVARGWCHKGNASKELDVVLAKAIADEIAELFAAAPPAQPAPETIADHERAYELLFKENARLRGRFEVAQDRAPLERFNLDCHYDGFDQMREFVLASDHDARVHDLETICDPAGIVTENALLKQTAKELVAMVNRLKRDAAQPAAQPVQLTDDVIDAQLPHGMAPHSTLVGPVEIRAFARKIAALQPQPVQRRPALASIESAPACLNMNDKAMWVTGWNECRDAIAARPGGAS
jgi:hypothetical protein